MNYFIDVSVDSKKPQQFFSKEVFSYVIVFTINNPSESLDLQFKKMKDNF